METNEEGGPPPFPVPRGPRLGYAEILETHFAVLSDTEQLVLERRLCRDKRDTLEAIGADLDCTREYVRQIQERGLARLVEGPRRYGTLASQRGRPRAAELEKALIAAKGRVIDSALSRLAGLALPVTEEGFVEAGFERFDALSTGLLLGIASQRELLGSTRLKVVEQPGGRRWLVAAGQTVKQLFDDLVRLPESGVIEDPVAVWTALEVDVRPHAGSDDEAQDIAAEVIEGLELVDMGGHYAVLGGSSGLVERVTRLLRANGGPLTGKQLQALLPAANPRTLENALLSPGFVRVDRDTFALEEHGLPPRPNLRDMVYAEIDQHGRVTMNYLGDRAETLGFSRNSIAFYAGLPDLISDGPVLRRRTADDPPAIPEPGLDDETFRVVAGPHEGRWSSFDAVDRDRLYYGSLTMPGALATAIGLVHGDRGVTVHVNGDPVRATFIGTEPHLWSKDLRPVLERADLLGNGHIRLIAIRPGNLRVERLPDAPASDSPYAVIVGTAGLYCATGAPLPDEDVVGALAYAVGLDRSAPVHLLDLRLAARRNTTLRAALLQVHPELRP